MSFKKASALVFFSLNPIGFFSKVFVHRSSCVSAESLVKRRPQLGETWIEENLRDCQSWFHVGLQPLWWGLGAHRLCAGRSTRAVFCRSDPKLTEGTLCCMCGTGTLEEQTNARVSPKKKTITSYLSL